MHGGVAVTFAGEQVGCSLEDEFFFLHAVPKKNRELKLD
jgi:hypothetical protein